MKKKTPDKDTAAYRLMQARQKAGFEKPMDAVSRFGWAQSTYMAHENGQNGIRPDAAKRYADAFHVDAGWLLTGEGNVPLGVLSQPCVMTSPTVSSPVAGTVFDVEGTEFARIPVYDVQFSAGFGANNDGEPVIDYQVMSVATLRRWTDSPVRQLSFIRVDGDSMEPLLFNDDWVLIDASNTNLISPAIYAIVYDGRGFLKHASKNIETGAVTLASHNPLYPPQTITRPDGLRIVGRVVLSIRKH